MPQRLRHGPYTYNCHLLGPAKPIPVVERLEVELLLPVLTTEVCPDRESNRHARRTLYLYATATVEVFVYTIILLDGIHKSTLIMIKIQVVM